MSSHHIVREKQEPALLIRSLDDFSFEQLGQLLEWSPTVIATMGTFPLLEKNHIKVDWLASDQLPESGQTHIKLIDAAVLPKLIQEGYRAVNIVDASSGADENLLGKYGGFIEQLDIVIYTANSKIYPVRSGFRKWKPAGETIHVINPPTDFTVKDLEPVSPGVYQTVADGFFTLEFSQPVVFITEGI